MAIPMAAPVAIPPFEFDLVLMVPRVPMAIPMVIPVAILMAAPMLPPL